MLLAYEIVFVFFIRKKESWVGTFGGYCIIFITNVNIKGHQEMRLWRWRMLPCIAATEVRVVRCALFGPVTYAYEYDCR